MPTQIKTPHTLKYADKPNLDKYIEIMFDHSSEAWTCNREDKHKQLLDV